MPPATRQTVMNAADMLAPAMTVGEVRESLDTTQKGQTANTIANCKTVFQCDPLLKGAVRFNWYSLVEYAMVYSREDIRFTFKNGMEIKA